jgi:serine/threonine protein kinase
LAVGGNPWNAAREAEVLERAHLPDLDWAALRMGELLGQGASGVIHAAHWPAGPVDGRELAVKVFKGEVTSDGWPHSEWAASLAAGAHPHLISASARLLGHPQGAEGLVMPRIESTFSTLAGPPSLSSCTRDVYADGLVMSADVLLQMARGVVAAARHLHQRGISHGDLYAHNLLWNGRGQVWLGDFGAASLLPDELGQAQRQAFERVEVLAFGLLLQEWLTRCPDVAPALQQLQADCVRAEPAERPLFEEVAAVLA